MDAPPILLLEWESITLNRGTDRRDPFLPDSVTRTLAQSLTAEGVLEVRELRNGLYLRASSFVGVIRLGEFQIQIEPKIRGMELMRLLRYTYGLRDLRLITQVSPSIEKHSFLDLLIQQLLAETQEILSRGLHRRYVPTSARLSSPKGRLDLQTLARDGLITASLPCRFHPRIENCLPNQVLLSGLRLAAGITQTHDLRSELRRTAAMIETSVDNARLDVATIAELRRQMNRLTISYDPAIAIVEILLNSSGVTLHGAPQQPKVPGFLFDMNRFFQRLLGRCLRESLQDHKVVEEESLKGLMAYTTKHNPHNRQAPLPRPDYCIKTNDGRTLLLDAKYRDLWEKELPRDMLYQLAIYALSQKSPGRATILYPTLDGSARDAVVEIYEPFSRTNRAEIVVRPVDLVKLVELLANAPAAGRQRQQFAERLLRNPN